MGLFDAIIDFFSDPWKTITGAVSGSFLEAITGPAIGAAIGLGAAALFGGSSSPPQLASAAPAPILDGSAGTDKSASVSDAEKKTRAAIASNRGRSATLLTGSLGLTDEAPTSKRTLLGG